MTFKEKQKEEAVKRMKFLELNEKAIEEFEEGKLNKSELVGFLYWLDEEEEKMVRKWEEETGNLAYHLILSNTSFGRLLTVLYVSKYEEEWESDHEDLKHEVAIAYVFNLDTPMFSEYGRIGFKKNIGGLIRTA